MNMKIINSFLQWILLGVITHLHAQEYERGSDASPFSSSEGGDLTGGLFPLIFNLASQASITTNATCGDHGPETYCKLVQHVKRLPEDRVQCGICDARVPADSHPIENAIDGSENWWQSPSIAEGKKYNWVTITLDLKQVYQVAYVIIKSGNSPRPGNWILEKSIDNKQWQTWQYFAMSRDQCMELYGIKAQNRIPVFQRDDEALCTSKYSRLNPLQDGEIYVSLINGRPGVDGLSKELMDFTTARYVRLRLQRIRTLHADLMTMGAGFPNDIDPTVSNRYYYSIKDISVGGQCICHGHATACPYDPYTGETQCKCEGNTCGKSCEMCCPLFNQKPYKVGTYSQGNVCEECNCYNKADACEYNQTVADLNLSINLHGKYEGGGVCIGCREFTMGNNCELCWDGFYRPTGVDPHARNPCLPCQCDGPGTTGICVKDDSLAHVGVMAGDCVCAPGFCGPDCGECESGYTGWPHCEPCPCNPAGSLNMDLCDEECFCKLHVCGEFCDECLPGYYNMQQHNPDGCDQCFCFGISDQCHSVSWARNHLTTLEDWTLTDVSGSGSFPSPRAQEDGSLVVDLSDITQLNRAIYWAAPKLYTGNKLASYGGMLEYLLQFSVNETGPDSEEGHLANSDFILESHGVRLGFGGRYYPADVANHINVNLTESGWRHLEGSSGSGDHVTREEFMAVLARVDRLLVRASYHVYQTQAKLIRLGLDIADENEGYGPLMPAVEQCICPPGYAGLSCESCADGYWRVGDILLGGSCVPCDCNGYANTCDPHTGECLNCNGNTAGPHCDVCAHGFRGVPFDGDTSLCLPCACPLESAENNFATECGTDGATGEYVCLSCMEGYEGEFCERCSYGYYGNPLQPGSKCMPCDCHGNTAPGETCDKDTGACPRCLGHTEGTHCERCRIGYFGSAENGDCKPCQCNQYGSLNQICDVKNGECQCKAKFVGRDCGFCQEGYGNIAKGCLPCNCTSARGAVSNQCDPVTGQCPCKEGIGGMYCEYCKSDHWDYNINGCKACGCHPEGSLYPDCDEYSGVCDCQPRVTGDKCDQCEYGYWGISSGSGCEECACDTIGSLTSTCDPSTGQCRCHPGIGGQNCDHCLPGYYGFSSTGCKDCPVCPLEGFVCDPVSGECTCPPNTEGELCENCVANTWGYNTLTGCKDCACVSMGSLSPQCNAETGQCSCRRHFSGDKCDRCQFGWYAFPDCLQCDCDAAGTSGCYDDGTCGCEPDSGACTCKENVIGSMCDRCAEGTFSLDVSNPAGCTECFCSGRSTNCQQAAYVWEKRTLPNRLITVSVGSNPNLRPSSQGYLIVPRYMDDIVIDAVDRDRPLFLDLGDMFKGDLTTSYNGKLDVTIKRNRLSPSASSDAPRPAPTVDLLGNYVIRLLHTTEEDADSENSSYSIRFRESVWQTGGGDRVDRPRMMVALQNVQSLILKLANTARLDSIDMSGMTFDVAVPAGGRRPTALGVESCSCPPHYEGLSCQNPAEGYYRRRPQDITIEIPPSDLLGRSELCQCNSHSDFCDPETAECYDCEHFTEGERCEICQPGYYGNAENGTPDDCERCACPSVIDNRSPTCYPVEGGDYVCDACDDGYGGIKCQLCAPGYYRSSDDSCVLCECSEHGSVTDVCDLDSGQCLCYPGVLGRQCDQCAPRYAIQDGGCVSCDEGCTGLLLADMDILVRRLANFNASSASILPWAYVRRTENNALILKSNLTAIDQTKVKDVLIEGEDLLDYFEGTQDSLDKYYSKHDLLMLHGQDLLLDAEELADDIESTQSTVKAHVFEAVRTVNETLLGQSFNLEGAIKDAEEMLSQMIDRSFDDHFVSTENELDQAMKNNEEAMELKRFSELDVNTTQARIDDDISRLRDLRKHIVNTNRESGGGKVANKDNRAKLSNIKTTIDQVKQKHDDNQKMLENSRSLLDEAKDKMIAQTRDNLAAIEDLHTQIDANSKQVDIKKGLLEDSVPLYTPAVEEAVTHGSQLEKQANRLEEQFLATKELASDPLRAAEGYESMKKAIWDASEAAAEAKEAVDGATEQSLQNQIKVMEGDYVSIVDRVDDIREQSEEDQVTAKSLKAKTEDYQPRIDKYKESLDSSEETHAKIKQHLGNISPVLSNFTRNMGVAAEAVLSQANKAQEKADSIAPKVKDVQKNLDDNLLPKLEELVNTDLNNLDTTENSVSAAKADFGKLLNLTRSLEERVAATRQLGEDVDLGLKVLRDRIRQARAQAQNIKVSLYQSGGCTRRYNAGLRPSASNNIQLHFKTNSTNPDMMLMLIYSKESGDYLALEMINRRVRLTWNAGAGVASVTHDLPIEVAQASSSEEAWYRVTVTRISTLGKLMVQSVSDTGPAKEVSAIAPEGSTVLDFDYSADLFVAGLPSKYQLPGVILTRRFEGCMGGVRVDGHDIGLFNFAQLYGQGCSGCADVPVIEPTRSVFQFSGLGYASLPQVPYKAETFGILLEFKALWDEALLFYSGSEDSGDFISLELDGGKVVFKYSFDGQSTAVIKTFRRYNTNEWVSVRANRVGRDGVLEVDRESRKGTAGGTGDHTELDLANSMVYFGGLNPVTKADRRLNVITRSFAGCMRNIQISSRGVWDQDLLEGVYAGVKPGCSDSAIQEAGLEGDGHIEFTSANLDRDADIAITFRTKQENGLLLLARGSTFDNYYSISLNDGKVSFWINAGLGRTELYSERTFNDGYYHTVSVSKRNRLIELKVNDAIEATGRMVDGASKIESVNEAKGLYIGGIPMWMFDAGGTAASLEAIVGCVRDIVINNNLRSMSAPESYSRADIGRCDVDRLFPGLPKPTRPDDTEDLEEPIILTSAAPTTPTSVVTTTTITTPTTTTLPTTITTSKPLPTSCARQGSFDSVRGAVAFGDILHSNAEISVKKRELTRDFSLGFEFRTFYDIGLLFYITNDEQTEFVAVQLNKGKIEIVYRGNTLSTGRQLGDGTWHMLNITKDQRTIEVQVDTQPATSAPITRKVHVAAPMYVGGLPAFFEPTIGLVSESFKGCLRGFELNDNEIDVANSKAIMGVRPCFSQLEPGVHFDGYGYAVYAENYHIEGNWSTTLQFRTTYMNGVIMAISSPSGNPALALELHNGKLKFTVVNDGGEFSAEAGECEHCLCDNQWHHVTAEYIKNVVTLKVDDGRMMVGVSPGYDQTLNTYSNLYIAGFPVFDRPSGAINTGDFFHGCLRNVVVNGTAIHWHGLNSLVDVHVAGCPMSGLEG